MGSVVVDCNNTNKSRGCFFSSLPSLSLHKTIFLPYHNYSTLASSPSPIRAAIDGFSNYETP